MLYDCSRYWLAIFRGGCKLELTFCLGWKTGILFYLNSELIYLNKAIHKLLAIQNLFAVAINLSPYQPQSAKYHRQIVLWKTS